MVKQILFIATLVMLATMTLAFASAEEIVIVVGANAASADFDAAQQIRESFQDSFDDSFPIYTNNTNNSSKNVSIVTDEDFDITNISSNLSKIIVIGGSCVNMVSAQLLDVTYPTCGQEFQSETGISSNEYITRRFVVSSLDDMNVTQKRTDAILIAGFTAQDTQEGVDYYISQWMQDDLDDLYNNSLRGQNLVFRG